MGTVRNARVNQGGPKCAGIVGLGLIGGSFARGYAQAGVRVLAWDPDDDVMTAASMGTVAGELNDKTLGECDIIVLACYPEACIEWLEAHAQALAATACGVNGLEIEVHDEPSRAWSDGAQALTPDQFDDTMRRIRAIREVVCQETVQE